MENKKTIVLFVITLIAVIAALCVPVSAYYFKDLETVTSGTVNGGVYVGGGHGSEWSFDPYTQDFTVPCGTIKWARLYIHVVGGGMAEADYNGWVNLTYWNGTGYTENKQYLDHAYDGSANDETQGYYVDDSYEMYWKYWNVTDVVKSGVNNVTAVRSGFREGNIAGIALVVVYDDGGEEATYWINDGCRLVGYDAPYPGVIRRHTTWFNGTIDTARNATLWTISAEGSYGSDEQDFIYFNGHQYPTDDAMDGGGSTPDSTWSHGLYFDIDSWVLDRTWLNPSSNNATVDCPEHGDVGDIYDLCCEVLISKVKKQDLIVPAVDTLVEREGQIPFAMVANHTYTINATIRNRGDLEAAGFNVTLRENETLKNDTYLSSLGPLTETVVQFDWMPELSGLYELNVTADAYDAVNESDETNNARTEIVAVLDDTGPADLVISADDITFLPAYGWHTANNNTIIKIKVTNNGTADAGSAGSEFKVQLLIEGVSTNATTWLNAKSYRYVEFERAISAGPHSVEVRLDPDNDVAESDTGNNNAVKSLKIISCRILNSHHYGNTSAYSGILSDYATVSMFDITKLAPENTTPAALLDSVADVVPGKNSAADSIDGLGVNRNEGGNPFFWYVYVNGIELSPVENKAYPLHGGEVVHYDIYTYVKIDSLSSFGPVPIMDYPEPFLHGYNGTVWNTTIVYPDELCYQAKANAVKDKLNASGVSNERISVVSVQNITEVQKNSSNLILLGTPSNNPLIAEVNSQYSDVGMTVYFSGSQSQMIDEYDDTSYELGGVVEACDNPFDGADWTGTGPFAWLATGIEDYWAYKAADLLASETGKLDRFWTIREPYLIPSWDDTSVTLDWGNWTGSGSTYDIYVTNNLTAGFPATPNETTTEKSWTDENAGDNDQRYYKVVNKTIEGNVTKITYELKKGAINRRTWITLPSNNPPVTNADELIKAIPNCDKVGWWNSTSQMMETYTKSPFGYGGTNFDVKPARGYEVTVTADATWTVAGWVPPLCPLKLKTGAINRRTWIGMPFNTTIEDADELIKDIPNCDKVGWWNSMSQKLETYTKSPFGYGGTNFDVKPARGYEVTVTSDTTWTPR